MPCGRWGNIPVPANSKEANGFLGHFQRPICILMNCFFLLEIFIAVSLRLQLDTKKWSALFRYFTGKWGALLEQGQVDPRRWVSREKCGKPF